jgi:hypothetical protein
MCHINRSYSVGMCVACMACVLFVTTQAASAFPLSSAAWSDSEWEAHCQSVKTSYNPHHPLTNTSLSLNPHDPRFLDFLYWV